MKYENGLGIEWQWISWKYWLIFAKNLAKKSMSFAASFKTFLYPKSLAQVCLSLACSGREKFPISRRDTNNKCRKLTSHGTESAKKARRLCCVYHPTFGPAEGASNSNNYKTIKSNFFLKCYLKLYIKIWNSFIISHCLNESQLNRQWHHGRVFGIFGPLAHLP